MRGSDERAGSLFSYVDIEERVPASHPLRKVRAIVNAALAALDADFGKLYAADGRPSIPPERVLRAARIGPRGRSVHIPPRRLQSCQAAEAACGLKEKHEGARKPQAKYRR